MTKYSNLIEKLESLSASCGVVGLGYVGLPLAVAAAQAGFHTIGFDIDPEKPRRILAGDSYIGAVRDAELTALVRSGHLEATVDFGRLGDCDVIVICVPTPLTKQREPDLSFVEDTARTIASFLRQDQLIVLESTTYPGTTREVVKPILEATGLRSGKDFFLGFSPEREDPGNQEFNTKQIPKVVSGEGPLAMKAVEVFYGCIVDRVVRVSSLDTAEAVKITENVFRAVNIALVNELKIVYDRMGIDIWEVIEAAKTKPFGFMPFYPGPGLGGHCIPIDPFYLTWKAREFDIPTRFIELAGEINTAMPRYVVSKLEEALDRHLAKPLGKARILILGLAYKNNVADVRESPSFKLMELLEARGATVAFHDPHVITAPRTREHARFSGMTSVPLNRDTLRTFDAALIATDHDNVDYALVANAVPVVVDTRNALGKRGLTNVGIVKA